MSNGFIIVLMVFFHIVDDYYLQRILSQMKQRSWWKENAPQPMYQNDWIIAMAMHAFSWSFMIMLPFAIQCGFRPSAIYYVSLIMNAVIHFIVDNFKANKKIFNLIQDQLIHLTQIFITWLMLTNLQIVSH